MYNKTTFNFTFDKIYASTQKEINSQSDAYLVILSSKTYVFEDKRTKY